MATTIQQIELPKKARAVDTSGNNNHGQIYSGRGLEFDGVSDHLLTGYGNGLNPYTTPITVATWVKTAAADGKIFIGPTSGTNQRFYIGHTGGAWDMGIQDSTWNSTTNEVSGFSDQPSYELDTWYRIVVVMSAGQATMYVNGVKSYAKTYTSYVFNSDITIGSFGDNTSYYWDGMMSDVQIWDAAFTQADVTYDYLNPESLALNGGGTALTESNLKLWYPMQDGHRGQQSYILDGANTGYTDKLVDQYGNAYGDIEGLEMHPSTANTIIHPTNSNIIFDNYLDPTVSLDTNIKYAGEQSLKVVTGIGGSGIYSARVDTSDRFSVIAGVTYKISGYIYRESGSGIIKLNTKTGAGGNWDLGGFVISPSSNETWEYWEAYYVASVSGDNAHVLINNTSAAETYYLDNIEWGPINDKHHATTVFYGDELWDGANGDVTNWTPFGNNTVEEDDGTLKFTYVDNVSGPYIYLRDAHHLSADLVVGATYELSITTKVNTGSATWRLQHNSYPTYTFSTLTSTDFVTQSVTFIATTVNSHYLFAGSFSAGEIVWVKDISLKEVGVASGWTDADQQLHIPQTALQSYNELAWFDGTSASNGYMDLDTKIATTDNDWSLSFWVIRQDTPETSYFIMGNEGNKFIALNTATDKLHYRDGDGTYHAISDSGIPYNEWTHVVVTATADTSMLAYVNGVAQTANSNMGDTEIVLKKFMIWVSAAHGTLGSINEISYYSDVLTAAEALDLFNDGKAKSALEASGSAGLVGYWRNNGLSEWKDLKGSNDGNTSAGVVETILIPQGVDSSRDAQGFIMNKQKDTSCLNLTNTANGPRTYVDLGSTTTIADDAAASFIMWIKPDDFSDHRFLTDGTNDRWRFQSSTIIECYADSTDMNFTVSTMTAGEWIHVALVRAADDDWYVYTNGNASSSNPVSQNKTFDYRYIGLGPNSDGVRGQIDGFLVYNKELSSTEILRNYNATKGSHRN